MAQSFARWIINTIAIMLAIKFVPGIIYSGEWWGILIVGMIFGLINTVIRPIVRFFSFPLILLTLGLFTLVINALMLSLTSWFSGHFHLGFSVQGFWPAFWGALIISVVSIILSWLIPSEESKNS